MRLAVVCCLWGFRYNEVHVKALQAMVAQHVRIPHRFVCLTDRLSIPGVETYRLRPIRGSRRGRANFGKLRAFDAGFQKSIGDRIVYFDLDCLLLSDITDVILHSGEFAIMEGTLTASGERRLCPYNSSFWVCDAGAREHFLSAFDIFRIPEIDAFNRRMVGSDQAWIAYASPHERTIGEAQGFHQYCRREIPASARAVFFAGKVKPWHDEAGHYAQIYREYMGANDGLRRQIA